ncbi:MAG TPA: SDR family NAD(P)-dependent oxidoreductase, partial [Acidimicrobiales bacterium]|nr:SDR family NAD(P)-dependent oxidoreductase [Acidimicrobiales bacterium]
MSDSRVVLVTGGARGLGRGLVEEFARTGDTVATCGRTEPADDTPAASFFQCDVRDPDQVAKLIDSIVVRHGRLDVAINNAGGT